MLPALIVNHALFSKHMVDNWLPGFDMNRQMGRYPSKRIEKQIAEQVDEVSLVTIPCHSTGPV